MKSVELIFHFLNFIFVIIIIVWALIVQHSVLPTSSKCMGEEESEWALFLIVCLPINFIRNKFRSFWLLLSTIFASRWPAYFLSVRCLFQEQEYNIFPTSDVEMTVLLQYLWVGLGIHVCLTVFTDILLNMDMENNNCIT